MTRGKGSHVYNSHPKAGRYRIATGYVGENGIKPNTPYRVENGKLVEAKR